MQQVQRAAHCLQPLKNIPRPLAAQVLPLPSEPAELFEHVKCHPQLDLFFGKFMEYVLGRIDSYEQSRQLMMHEARTAEERETVRQMLALVGPKGGPGWSGGFSSDQLGMEPDLAAAFELMDSIIKHNDLGAITVAWKLSDACIDAPYLTPEVPVAEVEYPPFGVTFFVDFPTNWVYFAQAGIYVPSFRLQHFKEHLGPGRMLVHKTPPSVKRRQMRITEHVVEEHAPGAGKARNKKRGRQERAS